MAVMQNLFYKNHYDNLIWDLETWVVVLEKNKYFIEIIF
jgi:hypothetical protein